MADDRDDGFKKDGDDHLTPLNINKKTGRTTAVALKDRTLERQLPQVVAAGRGKIAEKILQLAFENDIKVREDSALAEMLATIELDSPIPSEAFQAVAEILSYIYRANGQPNPFDAVLRDVMDEKEGRHYPMTEADDIRTRMRDICDTILDAIAKVESGVMVNLAGLDDDVASLCDRTVALPPAQAVEIQPLMADMISSLDRLGQALKDYQDHVKRGRTGQ